jgi:hypothetical protein
MDVVCIVLVVEAPGRSHGNISHVRLRFRTRSASADKPTALLVVHVERAIIRTVVAPAATVSDAASKFGSEGSCILGQAHHQHISATVTRLIETTDAPTRTPGDDTHINALKIIIQLPIRLVASIYILYARKSFWWWTPRFSGHHMRMRKEE